MKRIALAFTAILILLCVSARADLPLRQSPVGFCSLSSITSAVNLASCTTTTSPGVTITGVPPTANYALICAYVQGIVWNDVAVPTGTPGTGGQGLASGQCFSYTGPLSPQLPYSQGIEIIQQTSGAIVGVSFYK